MDCNRDEAMRAKSMAEIHMKANDFSSAAKFASLAQKLDPKIDGVSKMLSILNVYLSAERRIGSEVDWYGILRVEPTASEEVINRQYKRLALETHPDKNSTAGAAGAFKLVSEAKCLLLDKARRTAYDRIAGYETVPIKTEDSGSRANADSVFEGFPGFDFSPKPTKVQGKPTKAGETRQTVDLFWTVCYRCRVQLQYQTMFRNIVIKCLGCETTFVALEVPWPAARSRSHRPKPWPPRREEVRSGLKRRREWEVPPPFGSVNFEAGNGSGVAYQQPGVFEAVYNNFGGASTSGTAYWNASGVQQGTANEVNPSEEAETEAWGVEEDNRVGCDETVKNFYSCW